MAKKIYSTRNSVEVEKVEKVAIDGSPFNKEYRHKTEQETADTMRRLGYTKVAGQWVCKQDTTQANNANESPANDSGESSTPVWFILFLGLAFYWMLSGNGGHQ